MFLKRFSLLLLLIIMLILFSSGIGATESGNLWSYIFGNLSRKDSEVLVTIRLPRIATALLAGFLIGIAGACMQRAFVNPLAEPTLLGTTAAAALGSIIAILLGAASTNLFAVLAMAFLLAWLVSILTIRVSEKTNRLGSSLIIGGVALAALLNGLIAIIAAISGNQEIKAVGFWTSGTLSYARLDTVIVLSFVALVIFAAIPYLSRQLDLFVFNTVQLTLLGYSSNKLKLMALTITSLVVAATVVSIGAVAFLGLAAPFIARSLFGESMKQALLASGLIGALILLTADTVARSIASPSELPISIVTSLIGAPFLFALVLGRQGRQNA